MIGVGPLFWAKRMSDRAVLAESFVTGTEWSAAKRVALAGDASARRYFRLCLPDGRSAVLMDAPRDRRQDVTPFLRIARNLAGLGFSTPKILKADRATGFALLEDLGDDIFARVIERQPEMEERLYSAAVDVLIALHQVQPASDLSVFTPTTLSEQVAPVFDWYVHGMNGSVDTEAKSFFQGELETALRRTLNPAVVMILRDFHAENLIWLPDRTGVARVGLLDFQDALLGDPAYDLSSLLQDARRDVPPRLASRMIRRFIEATGTEADSFHAACAASGAQRNLRILGVFARLSLHFGKPHYVDLVPRVWGHLMTCLDHPDLAGIKALVQGILPPPTQKNLQNLRDKCATIPTP